MGVSWRSAWKSVEIYNVYKSIMIFCTILHRILFILFMFRHNLADVLPHHGQEGWVCKQALFVAWRWILNRTYYGFRVENQRLEFIRLIAVFLVETQISNIIQNIVGGCTHLNWLPLY